MKWQNLIKKRCPVCGEELERKQDHVIIYECVMGDFFMTQRKLATILQDEQHPLRKYAEEEDLKKLEEALAKL